ncbi:hypothetical protein ACVWZV_007875 [Bradyrhizobium sp. GM5.1]
MSPTLWISLFEYMWRTPCEPVAMTCRPCVVSSIMVLSASNTFGSARPLTTWFSSRNRKCNDITPACGEIVAVFAEEMIENSTSPAFTSWSTCGSCPSCAPGY